MQSAYWLHWIMLCVCCMRGPVQVAPTHDNKYYGSTLHVILDIMLSRFCFFLHVTMKTWMEPGHKAMNVVYTYWVYIVHQSNLDYPSSRLCSRTTEHTWSKYKIWMCDQVAHAQCWHMHNYCLLTITTVIQCIASWLTICKCEIQIHSSMDQSCNEINRWSALMSEFDMLLINQFEVHCMKKCSRNLRLLW